MLLVIVAGLFFVKAANYDPFIPPSQSTPEVEGPDAPLIQVLFGLTPAPSAGSASSPPPRSCSSPTSASTSSPPPPRRARNPQRDLPIGIVGSLVICAVLYVAVALVVTGMQRYTELDTEAPLADAFKAVGHAWVRDDHHVGAVVGLTTVMLILMLGQSRVFFAMSRDGLLPAGSRARASRVRHARTGRPSSSASSWRWSPAFIPLAELRRAGQHRHAVRVHHRLGRRRDPAPHPARPAARVPHPAGAAGARAGGRRLPVR